MRAATQASEFSPHPLSGAESNDPEAGPDLEVGPGFRRPGPLPGPTTGHAPSATTPCAAHAQPPRRPMDIVPKCPLPGPNAGHVPWRPARPLDMSPGEARPSVFMWFFID